MEITTKCLQYKGRDIILISLPQDVSEKQGFSTQAFYKSTDTSNEYGYPDTFFPFYGIDEKDWLIKDESSGTGFGIGVSVADWRQAVCDAMSLLDYDDKCKEMTNTIYVHGRGSNKLRPMKVERCCDLYINFLDKFTDWFEVRISALMGGNIWERSDFQYLRGLAFNYSWQATTIYQPHPVLFEKPDDEVPRDKIDAIRDMADIKGYFVEHHMIPMKKEDCIISTKEDINSWLTTNNARDRALSFVNEVYLQDTQF